MRKQISRLLVLTVASAIPAVPAALAQEEPVVTDDSRRCINLRTIRSTTVIDDRNILFYAGGDRVYHNILPSACRGLAREDRFSYEVRTGSLCNSDTISVLYDDAFGINDGPRCRLGLFHEITREDAEALVEHANEPPRSEPLPMPDPEEVGTGEDEERDPGNS